MNRLIVITAVAKNRLMSDVRYQRVVAHVERFQHQSAQTRQREHVLHDHRAADQDRELQADQGHHRDQRVLDQCRRMINRSLSPFAQAVRMKSWRSTSSIMVRVMRITVADR